MNARRTPHTPTIRGVRYKGNHGFASPYKISPYKTGDYLYFQFVVVPYGKWFYYATTVVHHMSHDVRMLMYQTKSTEDDVWREDGTNIQNHNLYSKNIP